MADLMRCAELSETAELEVEQLFEYQPWDPTQRAAGKAVKDRLAEAFKMALAMVPPCPTRTRGLNMLLDARMLFNSAITHRGKY